MISVKMDISDVLEEGPASEILIFATLPLAAQTKHVFFESVLLMFFRQVGLIQTNGMEWRAVSDYFAHLPNEPRNDV